MSGEGKASSSCQIVCVVRERGMKGGNWRVDGLIAGGGCKPVVSERVLEGGVEFLASLFKGVPR